MTRHVPFEAHQLAETYRMGKPTAVYGTDFKFQLYSVLVISGCMLVFSLPMALCSNNFRFGYYSWLLYGILLGCVLFACLLVSIIIVVPRIPVRDFCIYVCTDGLICKKQHGIEIVRWDEIERVDYAGILRKDGQKIEINRYINFNALEKNVKRKMKRYRQIQSQQISNMDI